MRRGLASGGMALLLALTVVFGDSGARAPQPVAPAAALRPAVSTVPAACLHPSTKRFWPTRANVQFVARRVPVLWMGRYSGGVPKPPPLTTSGKHSFGWDKAGPKPGSRYGNVRFNAHTYPDGSALGNWMLARLGVGARIIVRNNYGKTICYKVTKRIEVTPRSYAARVAYYNTTGRPKLAIVVCSGTRLGPGNWTRRTIWYARPSTS